MKMMQQDDNSNSNILTIGRLVEVQSRTWPGINKPGGVARVSLVHFAPNINSSSSDTTTTTPSQENVISHVDVHYIVGRGKEKRVPIEYVTLAPQYERTSSTSTVKGAFTATSTSLRDRSMLLGRCRRCGSLRTDCGSCDWAAMEQDFTLEDNNNQQQQQQEQQPSVDAGDERRRTVKKICTKRRSKRSTSQHTRRRSQMPDEGGQSSEEEEELLQQLINKKSYRDYLRRKSRREQLMNSSSSSSSSEEDEDGDKLSDTTQPQRKDDSVFSVLETLGQQHLSTTSSTYAGKRQRSRMASREIRSRRQSRTKKPLLQYGIENTIPSDSHNRQSPNVDTNEKRDGGLSNCNSPVMQDSREDVIAIFSSSSSASSSSSSSESSLDRPLRQLGTRDSSRGPLGHSTNNDGDGNDRLRVGLAGDDYNTSIKLSQFIQPEGKEAAENLPKDTHDRTRSLLYRDLPQFFDNMATNIEEKLVPDAKLKVAEQQKFLTELESPHELSDDKGPALAEECQRLRVHLTEHLIRDGTDQCRAAIRRLMDEKLYRKHKKSLTPIERKQCRSTDAREFRMDALDEIVEDLVRKVNYLLDAFTDREDRAFQADDENEEGSVGSGLVLQDDHLTQDLLPNSRVVAESFRLGSVERVLPPFRPHMHASRVKEKPSLRKHVYNSRAKARSSGPKMLRKRNSANASELRANKHVQVVDHPTRRGGLARRPGSQHSTMDEQQSVADVGTERSNFGDLATDEDQVPTFSIFDPPNGAMSEPVRNTRLTASAPSRRLGHQVLANNLESPTSPERASLCDRAVPISERMQAFLDANSGNTMVFPSSPDHEIPRQNDKGHRHKRRRRHHRGGLAEAQSSVRQQQGGVERNGPMQQDQRDMNEDLHQLAFEDDEGGPVNSAGTSLLTVEELCHHLRNRPDQNQTVSVSPPHTADIARCCQELRSGYPQFVERCKISLDGIRSLLDQGTSPDLAVSFLSTALDILQEHGTATLQELITCESPILRIHIRLLVECLHALQLRLPIGIGRDNGVLHKVFASPSSNFVDFLVLQLVDSTYSIFHPQAWTLQVQNQGSILDDLNLLRDALAGVTSLAESVCHCISGDLGCQEWRVGQNRKHVFVSSVCPESWRAFLGSGKSPQPPQKTRLAALGKPLPRIEVEALWKLLAYFGAPKSLPADVKSIARWQIMSKLFSSVFYTNPSDGSSGIPLPPSYAQILSCEKELGYLGELLFAGALENLPSSDSVIKNLIQRSLSIQADSYLAETDDRTSSLNLELDKRTIGNIWKASLPVSCDQDDDITPQGSYPVFHSPQFLTRSDQTNCLQGMVLPSSPILSRCLALLHAWMQRVPPKKARQFRLTKTISELVKSLVDQAMTLETRPPGDSFEAMFATSPSNRPAIFLREAASFICVVHALFKAGDQSVNTPDQLNALTPQERYEVWNILADDSMKKYLTSLSTTAKTSGDCFKYNGSALRPFAAAKVMSFLVLAQMGVSPWNLSSGSDAVVLPLKRQKTGETGQGAIVFPVTCLFTCLNCLCDLECEPTIMTRAYSLVAVVYTNAIARMASGNSLDHNLRSSIVHLGKVSPGLFIPTLVKCFQFGTRIANRSHLENAQFRSLLSVLRGVLSLGATSYQAKKSPSTAPVSVAVDARLVAKEEAPGTDEVWGDLDDDVFASMDLGDTEPTLSPSLQSCHNGMRSLWSCLTRSLDLSKPSKQFAISNHSVAGWGSQADTMSVHGKALVRRNLEKICECLVVIAALDCGNHSWLAGVFNELLGRLTATEVFDGDNGDPEYCMAAARQICSSLCSLAPLFSNCQTIFSSNFQNILFSLIETLTDFSSLESFPTSNLRRICENGGEEAAQRAHVLLTIVNTNATAVLDASGQMSADLAAMQRKRWKKADGVWIFCRSFGLGLGQSEVTAHEAVKMIEATLLDQDEVSCSDQQSKLETVSMEMEALKRFCVLRGIIAATARFQASASVFNFERISSLAIATCLHQIFRIAQSLQYHDRFCEGEIGKDFRRAKLVELLSTASVVTTALFSWILRETRHAGSDEWEYLLSRLRDRLTQSQGIDTGGAMSQIFEAARSLVSMAARRGKGTYTVSLAPYISGIFNSATQRNRQLLVHAARAKCPVGQGVVFQLLSANYASSPHEEIAWAIASSFQDRLDSLPRSRFGFQSPLEEGIDEYLRSVEMSSPLAGSESLAKLKHYGLTSVIGHTLNRTSTCLNAKEWALVLARNIFTADRICGTQCNLSSTELQMLSLLAKGISSSLRTVLAAKVVNSDFVVAVLKTFHAMMIKPVYSNGKSQSLIQWSRTNCAGLGRIPALGEGSIIQRHATYLWIVTGWLFSIGKLIADASRDDENLTLLSFRDQCRQSRWESCCSAVEDNLTEAAPNLVPKMSVGFLDSSLRCLEKTLFPDMRESNATILNVYAKMKNTTSEPSDDSPLISWDPPTTVVRRAKELMAEVIPLCYRTTGRRS